MKRILLVMLLLALVVQPTGARERSKIVMIKVLHTTATRNDYMYRYAAAVRQICANRGIELDEYDWDGRDLNKFRRLLRNLGDDYGPRTGSAKNYEFAVIVGGSSYAAHSATAGPGSEAEDGLIRKLWEPDSTGVSVLPTLVWWSHAAYGETAAVGDRLYNCGLQHVADAQYRLLLGTGVSRWWAFHTQSDHADTFWTYNQHDNQSNGGGAGDGATAIDTILTSANYPVDGTNNKEGFLALWSRTGDIGQPFYYCGLADGAINAIIDAIICRHVTNFNRLAFAIDIDDFGMSGHTTSMNTRAGVSSIDLTHANLFKNIDSLFAVIDRYDMVLTVGATANYLRTPTTGYVADNQWDEWAAIAEKWSDNDAIRWTVHQHGAENTADSVSQFFASENSYSSFFGKLSGPVTVARIDSVYQVNIDSLESLYGVTIDNYVIPPWDNLDGYNDDLQDTIAVWLASRGYAVRAKYNESTTDIYKNTEWYRGAKFLNCQYITNTLDTLYLRYSDTGFSGKATMLWYTMMGPMFNNRQSMTGTNPQQAAPGPITWSNYALYGLYKYEYTGRIDGRVLVMHFGACYTGVPGAEARNVTLIKELGQLIRYLEELSGGKDLYRCVSGEELATRYWEQVR